MSDNIFEAFNRQLREGALKQLKEQEKTKKKNPKSCEKFEKIYVKKYQHIDDYWA